MQDAVDKATLQWPLFAAYHQAFGTVQRFRDDTYTEAISPAKSVAATPPPPQHLGVMRHRAGKNTEVCATML
jgi:hypothetical protein